MARQILRYPYEALTDKTDYLQIDIVSYQSVKERTGNLVSGSASRIIGSYRGQDSTDLSVNDTSGLGKIDKKNLSNSSLKEDQGTIFLPMPSNIQDGNAVTYADDSLNGIAAAAADKIVDVFDTDLKPQDLAAKFSGLAGLLDSSTAEGKALLSTMNKALAAQAVGIFGGNITVDQLFARQQGEILNPNMELLFNGVTLRSFKFSFKLTPRSEKEAEQVQLIIRSLKQNMAPKTGSNQYFLKAPNIFELRYKSGITEHPFLHKFKQCALTDMSVNYTGENVYATYAGNLKSPVSMIMDLTFKELEPIYNEDYNLANSGPGVGY